ncbi:hypothetical protein [Streptomyces lateritius]|uniref:hypothetical protein n=1 Tax=Streptomyces lateritius TaxID=67313 RepID=UPI001C8CEE45|nr:hypothetical protein [Streptomyces lateritius]MBX9427390.1 hypothetical protein [Streptomyces lateritius]
MFAAGAADSWQATFASLVREVAASNPGGAAGGALRSTLDMAQNAEEELAVDHLCHVINYFNLSISRTQYEKLTELAGQLGVGDIPQLTDLEPSLGD